MTSDEEQNAGTSELERELNAIQNERASGHHNDLDDDSIEPDNEHQVALQTATIDADENEDADEDADNRAKPIDETKTPSYSHIIWAGLLLVLLSLILAAWFFNERLRATFLNVSEQPATTQNITLSAPELERYLHQFGQSFFAKHDRKHDRKHDTAELSAKLAILQEGMDAQRQINQQLSRQLDTLTAVLRQNNRAAEPSQQPAFSYPDLSVLNENMALVSANLKRFAPLLRLSADLKDNQTVLDELLRQFGQLRINMQAAVTASPQTVVDSSLINSSLIDSSLIDSNNSRSSAEHHVESPSQPQEIVWRNKNDWTLKLISKGFAQAINLNNHQQLRLTVGVEVPGCGIVIDINVGKRKVNTQHCVITSRVAL